MSKPTPQQIKYNLSLFTGSENIYKYILGYRLTDGAKYLAESCGCYWLIDIIASYKHIPEVAKEPFQVYKLIVKDSKGVVTVEDGNDNILYTQEIPFTDFPLSEVTVWMTDDVIMLPSEY